MPGIKNAGETVMIIDLQRIIEQETKLHIQESRLRVETNLYELGLTAFDTIRVLVAIERAFRVEFPREMLTRQSAASVGAIIAILQAIQLASEKMRAAA